MTTQNVIGQFGNFFGRTVGTGASQNKQSGNGFDMVMDSNLKVANDADTNQAPKDNKAVTQSKETNKDYDKATSASEKDTSKKAVQKEDREGSKQVNETSNKDSDKVKSSTKTEEMSSRETDQVADEKTEDSLVAKIQQMIETIRQTVMELLNLTPQEFNKLMEEQGLSPVDLTNMDALKQLVLAAEGESDITAFLTNENLADKMNQLTQAVNRVQEETGLMLTPDQMKLLLEQAEQASKEADSGNLLTNELDHDGETAKLNEELQPMNKDVKDRSQLQSGNQKQIQVEIANVNKSEDTNSGTYSEHGDESSSDSDMTKQFNTFVNQMAEASGQTKVDYSANVVRITELREIANQIIERIKVIIKPEQTSMELQLNPEHLGKVNLTLQSKNGAMTAHFVVQNELAKEAIEGQMHTLRETLNNQGIKVEAIEVTVETHAFMQDGQAQTQDNMPEQKNQSGRQITLEEAMDMNELQEEESKGVDITGLRGNMIDYTA
ncbi:flagellar hook-length control protein FliK [Mobilitalea sibirica]|uniref:Flagellar hook-length control protein FliK n=1 Tax=Mobilitalea sibirica TaxID=1462919 RepID=A0A8J7HEE3_9FIRM|nr:flagellar hook-length control protein FliK [Mobilitalea sibirica]MBH1941989.1 flagellar hook-length control protein FliK [Mobilitalea sibirica]